MKGLFSMQQIPEKNIFNSWKYLLFSFFLFLFMVTPGYARDVTLQWSPNSEPDLAGYRIFYREAGQSYDYLNPSWECINTSCTIYDLEEDKTYYFVVRSFNTKGLESDDSNQVCLEPTVTDDQGSAGSDTTNSEPTVTDDQGSTGSDTTNSGERSGSALEIEAEDMPVKTTGESTSGGWNIWSNGYIADTVDFPAEGTYMFEVRARGSYAGEAWPIMEVRIDGDVIGTVTVDASSWTVYTIQAYVSSGTHEVAIAFTNDYYRRRRDRNLYVNKITITRLGGSSSSNNALPVASIYSNSIGGIAPIRINFDGSGSYDQDGNIVSYDWNFGDGATGSGQTVRHTFYDPGVYTVRLTVTDDQGSTGSDTLEISAASGSGLEIEAEDMPVKTTGRYTSGGWNIWSNGYIADTVDFSTGGTYTFEVRARGSYAGGAWPVMKIGIDRNEVGAVTVDTSDWAVYTIQAHVSSGSHEVEIAFTNDYYNPPEDRNLYVDKVTIYP
jgi:PKD repeat protein